MSIIASVGLRTAPYRLNTGMPCAGSVKSGELDHVVLLVAAQTVLRTEGGGELDVTACGQRVEGMVQVLGNRRGVGKQGDAPAFERRAQGGFGEKPVDAEFHGRYGAGSSSAKQSE